MTMDSILNSDLEPIRDAIGKICAQFDDQYWLTKDREGGFPQELHQTLAIVAESHVHVESRPAPPLALTMEASC